MSPYSLIDELFQIICLLVFSTPRIDTLDLSRNYSSRKILNVSGTFYYHSNVFRCFFYGFRGIFTSFLYGHTITLKVYYIFLVNSYCFHTDELDCFGSRTLLVSACFCDSSRI